MNQTDVKDLPVALPVRGEQLAVADRMADAEIRIRGEGSHLDKLRTLKHGLMDDLLTGRVRVVAAEAAEQ